MPTFQYIIASPEGIKEEGTINGASRENVAEKLRKKNKIILSLSEQKQAHTRFWEKPHLSTEDKMILTTNLSTMIKAGIPITEALNIIIDQTPKKKNKKMFKNILEMIHAGETLAKSMKAYNFVFSELYTNMVASGEESGNLTNVLDYLGLQLEKENELKKKIISAFMYPMVIIGMTILLALGIMIFIMPKIIKVFESFDIDLPLPTRIVIGISNFMVQKPLILILWITAFIIIMKILFSLKFMKPGINRLIFHIPICGKIIKYANLARISRLLNSLLQAGVPITKTLEIIGKTINNQIYKNAILEAAAKVEQGGKLGESFNEKLFPLLWTKMILIGEKSGSLELATSRLSDLYEKNVDNMTKNLSVMIEPILLLLMGGMVGGLALAIIMPIYQLPNLIKR